MIAKLMNWDDENRRSGNAYIKLMDETGNLADDSVTVAPGQSAKKALNAAGWEIKSGIRRHNGAISFLVEKKRPGLGDVNAVMTSLIARTGII